jgi:hypothetical protein
LLVPPVNHDRYEVDRFIALRRRCGLPSRDCGSRQGVSNFPSGSRPLFKGDHARVEEDDAMTFGIAGQADLSPAWH